MLGGVVLRLPDCGDHEALPNCSPIKRVVNLGSRDARLEFRVPGGAMDGWAPLIPVVRAGAAHELPNAAIYVPRGSRIRAVDAREPEGPLCPTLRDFGVVGDAMIIVLPPDE